MKKLHLIYPGVVFFLIIGLVSSVIAITYTYTFSPSPGDMQDLDHQYYYFWKIQPSIPSGQIITDASFTYTNIYDWQVESGDRLHTWLFDTTPSGGTALSANTWRWWDNEGGGDSWANWQEGTKINVGTWWDEGGGPGRNFNLIYPFSSLGLLDELNAYAANGVFGFGIDPDCHYFNEGIVFTITTVDDHIPNDVPEPATILLLGSGLLGLAGFRKKFKK